MIRPGSISSLGTVRSAMDARGGNPPRNGALAALRTRGDRAELVDEILPIAEEILRARPLAPDAKDNLHDAAGILLVIAMMALRQGATRIPLASPGVIDEQVRMLARLARGGTNNDGHAFDATAVSRGIARLIARPSLSHGLIGAPGDDAPLIIDDDSIYAHRTFVLELATARDIAARIAQPIPADAAADRETVLAQIDAEPLPHPLSVEQRRAVAASISQSLTVVAGGPGTGKTAIAVAIVRALHRSGATRIAMASPTGKAAHRLTRVMAEALALARSPADRALVDSPPQAMTLHRLLGAGADGFRHHRLFPLAIDAVLVDEASMIDLRLMAALLDALPTHARLVLLGDADQLPSVDAGQTLADLVSAAGNAPWLTRLTTSYRMNPRDPAGRAILAAATAIAAGDADALLSETTPLLSRMSALPDPVVGAVQLDPHGELHAIHAAVDAHWRAHTDDSFWAAARHEFRHQEGSFVADDARIIDTLLHHIDAVRLLAVTRGQATGTTALNERMHRHMLAASGAAFAEFLPGEPVMMTGNDHERGLFNGDTGVVLRVRADDQPQRFRVVFRRDDTLVPFPLEALRGRIELAWAITVHKSQGSEFDAAVIVLPIDDGPLTTRELLYTAVTRARTGVTVVGSSATVSNAISRRVERSSGLAARVRKHLVATVEAACVHEVILNGMCTVCGTTDIDPVAQSPKPNTVVPISALTKKRGKP